MEALLFEPFLIRPHSIHTPADAVASMAANSRRHPAEEQIIKNRNDYFWIVRQTADIVCEILDKDRSEIALEEILGLDDALIRYALAEGIDRKHASKYATAGRKLSLRNQLHISLSFQCARVVNLRD